MKTIVVLCLIVFSSSASADSLFRFKDGSAHVWESYYNKGAQYCTMKSYGEYCVARNDIASITTVPPGTAASEYGVSSFGDSGLEQQRDENIKALGSLNCAQLKSSTSAQAQEEYRNECLDKEQKQEWDEEQMRKETRQRATQNEEARARHEEEMSRKHRELQQKVAPARPRSAQY